MPRPPRSVLVLLAAMFALLAWASTAQAERATVVGPGGSIQAAVDAAEPGDTILVFGTHRENVAIETDGLTLRGVGAVIRPPATPAVHGCFDPTEVGEAVHGICAVGDVDFDTGEIVRYVDGVTVSGFTIRGFAGFGLVATAASRTLFKDNVTSNNRDGGINATQSLDTRILANHASGGRFGVLVTGALGGTVAANSLHHNCVGALLFVAAAEYRLAANQIDRNTQVCPAVPDEWPALSGTGVAVYAASSNTIVANLITGNVPAGDTDFSGGVVVTGEPGFPSTDTVVKANAILRNDPDVYWDQSGTGNVFQDNLCRTSVPPDLCG
jgi:nitrous oxidase accessory protein NosD